MPGRFVFTISLGSHVSALKAIFLSSFTGIRTSITHMSAACAFITRDQQLSSPKSSSGQTSYSDLVQLSNLSQLGKVSFAASVWGRI